MSERDDDTGILFSSLESGDAVPRRRRRGRGWIVAAWIVGVFLVLAVVAFFVTDGLLRSSAEALAATEIEQNLPAGVTGTVQVKIDGGPVIFQYLSGTFERIEVTAPSLKANDVPLAVHVVATGVPTDLSKPVQHISGTATLDQDAVNAALKVPDAASGVTLGDGVVTYNGSQTVLGFPVDYTVTAKPSVSGPNILLAPKDVHVTSGPINLDLTAVVTSLLNQKPVPVCVADQLPAAVHLTSVTVKPSHVVLTLEASNITLTGSDLSTKGTCS